MLDLPGWATLKIPAKGGLWNKWAAVKNEVLRRPPGVSNIQDVHNYARSHVTYKREPVAADDWQKPTDTLKRGAGDCEDFAVLERALLLSVGYKEADLYVVVLNEAMAGFSGTQDHAVVFCGDHYLDCRTGNVLHKSQFKDARPIFAFKQNLAYLFGRKL